MSRSEANTAITPAIGAIQNTSGDTELEVDDANACKGMNIFDKACPFSIYVFPRKLGVVMVKSVVCMNRS
jgi:hypothetical protein